MLLLLCPDGSLVDSFRRILFIQRKSRKRETGGATGLLPPLHAHTGMVASCVYRKERERNGELVNLHPHGLVGMKVEFQKVALRRVTPSVR